MSTVFLPSPNRAPRYGTKVDHLVVHWIVGSLASADATFRNADSQVSAHYGIEGTVVHQYVPDSETAWHAGTRTENQRSIGIEHSAAPGRAASQATIDTSVALMTRLCRMYGISPDHIYPHKRFTATQCPGTLPVAVMVARVRANLATTTWSVAPPPLELEPRMADIVLTNPLTKESASAATGLNSTWFYSVASYQLLKELAAKAGVTIDVDEAAIAAGVAKLLVPTLQANVTTMTDADVAAIAKAVADEQARRLVS